MLARTFKTAEELGLVPHEHQALCDVLFGVESGEIPLEKINMSRFHSELNCGTAHCLAGWAYTLNNEAFTEIAPIQGVWGGACRQRASAMLGRLPKELSYLFGIRGGGDMQFASPPRAVSALRQYLETGRCPRNT